MNKKLTTIFAVAVACVTAVAQAQDVKGDAKAGEGKIAMCIGCHGIPGYQASFPEVYKVPMISGQNAGYIASALQAYKKGDRRHPTMRGIADSLSDQDIADVAAYYAGQARQGGAPAKPSREPGAQVAQLLQKGACVSCHGENFSKPIDPSYPKIAGQHPDYLFAALKAYKTGGPAAATVGRSNAIMAGIAKQFSNAELKALSGYLGSLDGELQVVPQSRFR
ncbi:c-type cytochrome [Paracidovorax avenae]|uniref:c-type cytochrome n=1 Tax=Paracidovorax avenae TaxID=80867 RepID=UPI000D1635FD|nr:c-type cytochrome [Paracidovorax avenae]AVS78820.1 cytochrome c4 [Paracidovorax avenae]AVS85925.1 cytochrome c4 [Paracidovorax avenae]AVS89601.1 cytochrome c4 [Paracidovorax avenae]AVS96663.1 cytochrome c4 [Paracidovorax avenae]AVT03776.1 cytochrome c4 [Paracidovorax avenae]